MSRATATAAGAGVIGIGLVTLGAAYYAARKREHATRPTSLGGALVGQGLGESVTVHLMPLGVLSVGILAAGLMQKLE